MRRPAPLIFALVLVNALVLTALIPLAPTFTDELSLSKLQIGAVFTATGIATLAVAIPSGLLTDRVGARRLTILSAALLTVSSVGQGAAVDFWSLFVARLLFGVGFTMALTAGLAWLATTVPPERRSAALGAVFPVAGAGGLAGPALAGVLTELVGVSAVFLAMAPVGLMLTVALARADGHDDERHGHQPLSASLRAMRRENLVLGGVLLMLVGGTAEAVVNVLAPLQLDRNGLSAGSIGIVVAVAGGLFVLASTAAARFAGRAADLRVGGAVLALLAGSLAVLAVSASTPEVIAGIVARTALMGVLVTIAFPLGALGAARAGLGLGAVNGMLMLANGAANVVGPLGGAALAESTSDRLAYAVTIACCLGTAAWMLAPARVAPRGVLDRP